ncbi:alpha/beta hydrolase [Paenibacillus sp. J5C_2022]|uniref:alpha/beta fold hydrolase n=1 Tax=Paenibacillus sp. J5C2022 TaxID=2977129 RepID=UPI0021CF09C2|nr:alpha/beta hydrolase [Paenibacillus sp. J5C2022]MCU6713000.1 alpha/beta hydrolase [Paenibacillus sp. J5C2022]
MNRFKSAKGKELIYQSYDRLLNSLDMEYDELDIPTSYGITHLITSGSPLNPSLLLLHGTADNSAMMWVYNLKPLAERFHVIAIDAIGGSGRSEPYAQYYRTFQQEYWLDEVLKAMRIERTYVAGVSYGAQLAQHFAIMRPEKVEKIVCMAGAISGSQLEVMSKMMKAFLPEALFPTRAGCEKLLRKLSGPYYTTFSNNTQLMEHWYYLLKYFNNRSMMKHKITIFTDEQLSGIREKALFLIGDHDMLSYYPKSLERLKKHQMTYKIVRGGGHAVNHELPEVVNKEMIDYLLKS